MVLRGRQDFELLDPRLQRFAEVFRKRAIRLFSVPLVMTTGYRPKSSQVAMFVTGKTNTGWPKSAHNHGRAVNIKHALIPFSRLDELSISLIGDIGQAAAEALQRRPEFKGCSIAWGDQGNPQHWELRGDT